MKRLIYAPNIGTTYSDFPDNYPIFGVYRNTTGSATLRWYCGGMREYAKLADALAWANSIL